MPLGDGPNSAQFRYWNDLASNRWVTSADEIDAIVGPFGESAIAALDLEPGEGVLDVGCGCGATTIDAARRVAPGGEALGIDLSLPMLAAARRRAAAEGVTNARFQQGDVQTRDLGSRRFDAVISRFGVMFFAEPGAAFANIAGALREGGRLAFVTWQPLGQNPWMLVPIMAAAEHLPALSAPPVGGPGPFSLGDPDELASLLRRAGLTDVAVTSLERVLSIPASEIEDSVEIVLRTGPLGEAVAAAADPAVAGAVRDAIAEAVAPYMDDEGLALPGAAWLATGRRVAL
ncbi:MAG: methyltransferase domain-containing protein [Acidimicrobiia bacterium]|nr:methyltransferase domain-containing protein [Acidimicrobiia bacterium]